MIKRGLFLLFLILVTPLPSIAEGSESVNEATTIVATEIITITKDIDINVSLSAEVDRAIESEVISKQLVTGNSLCKNCNLSPEEVSNRPLPPPLESEARIDGSSFVETRGVINVNQAPGSMNNQDNMLNISFNATEGITEGLIHSQSWIEQGTIGNSIDIRYTTTQDIITGDAFKDSEGIINVNQSAGNMNNLHNSEIISIGGSIILTDLSLGQVSSGNTITEIGTYKYDVISGNAFSGVTGIVSVNQSSGNLNNISSTIIISVNGAGL